MSNISTLRPGLLVSLKTTLQGNATYFRSDIEQDHYNATGERVAKWETERVIQDPAEYEDGIKARADARNAITRVCSNSAFGLLCPNANRDALDEAVSKAQQIVNGFNSRAARTTVKLYVIIGRIADDDVEAVRAINSEISDLIQTMERGVRNCEPKTIRDAANKARQLGQMLTPEATARVESALVTARAVARNIVKAGEAAALKIDQGALATLADARTAFLDLDEPANVERVELSIPETGRAIDLEPVTADNLSPSLRAQAFPPVPTLQFDF